MLTLARPPENGLQRALASVQIPPDLEAEHVALDVATDNVAVTCTRPEIPRARRRHAPRWGVRH